MEEFGQYILNALYGTLNLAPGLQRQQRFDSLTKRIRERIFLHSGCRIPQLLMDI
ncbi:hypothetical protein DPMN_085797 [Dreissena polymorpha]|uniref:Uncharacterized protein n=1 Tax=Dreissena polymorpha TaxID=45954 RepID=A0A9D3YD06_DREPO|nr:hypothetical protein DPMN_085797 [Dreissena polymorpha]